MLGFTFSLLVIWKQAGVLFRHARLLLPPSHLSFDKNFKLQGAAETKFRHTGFLKRVKDSVYHLLDTT